MNIIKNMFSTMPSPINKKIHHNLIDNIVNRLKRIEDMSVKNKTFVYNFRYDINETLWEPKLKDTILDYKKNCEQTMNNPMYDLIYRSRYSNNLDNFKSGFIKIFSQLNQSIVMSDFIMFNKNYEINFLEVDRLLPYCKIKVVDSENYILDGWNYKTLGMYVCGSNTPNKEIKFDMSNYHNMELVKTEEEKRLAVRALIQIMNEVPEEEINMHNYYTISEWYNYYDSKLNSYNGNEYNIKIKEDTKLVGNVCVEINKLLTESEIFEILYRNAKYGSRDYYDMFGSNEHVNILDSDIHQTKFKDATIDTNISDQKIDLKNYLKHNGITRTNNVINEIEHKKKNRINCSLYKNNITPEQLIVEIHNNTCPYGMGYLSHENKKLTIDEAKKILNESNYIDYLNGIAFKLDFGYFPILDISKCEDRLGQGYIIKCLKNIK